MDQATAITTITDMILALGTIALAVLGAVLTAMFLYDVIIIGIKRVYRKFKGSAN
jgi:hypothetical protein